MFSFASILLALSFVSCEQSVNLGISRIGDFSLFITLQGKTSLQSSTQASSCRLTFSDRPAVWAISSRRSQNGKRHIETAAAAVRNQSRGTKSKLAPQRPEQQCNIMPPPLHFGFAHTDTCLGRSHSTARLTKRMPTFPPHSRGLLPCASSGRVASPPR